MACGMVAVVAAVYVVVVVGGGLVIGRTSRPDLLLSLVATAAVAVGFEPVRSALARRWSVSPYDRLAGFASTMASAVATAELVPELARRVGEGTGAAVTEVSLRSTVPESGMRLDARWPPSNTDAAPGAVTVHRYPIRQGQEDVGWLSVRERPGRPLEPIERRLVTDLCAQAGLALRSVQLAEDLQRRVVESQEGAEELRSSRQRVVAERSSRCRCGSCSPRTTIWSDRG